ncbi:MAG TPA: acylphosphatase [Candidatus Aenigmarchaeota archaeon]|nr:acylphosphatase [Candidatus Aenigmarchaeota archaeon]
MKRVRVKIFGRVQGVFFRYNTRKIAERLGVKGWIRNCEDGSVEAVFEGEDKAVDKIIKWCHKGPSLAKVEKVDVEEEIYRGEFKDFRIVY